MSETVAALAHLTAVRVLTLVNNRATTHPARGATAYVLPHQRHTQVPVSARAVDVLLERAWGSIEVDIPACAEWPCLRSVLNDHLRLLLTRGVAYRPDSVATAVGCCVGGGVAVTVAS